MANSSELRLGFVAGILSGLVSISLMYALRISQLGVFIPEEAVSKLVGITPGSLESFFISQMGEFAKYTAFVVAILIFVIIHGIYGLAGPAVRRRFVRRSSIIGVYAALPAAINLLVILPSLGVGLLGATTSIGWAAATGSTLASSFVYSVLFEAVDTNLNKSYPSGFNLSRRTFIKASAAVALGLVIVAYGLNRLVLQTARAGFKSVEELFSNEITPNEKFYVVTKNLNDPVVDGKSWSLTIDGQVQRSLSFSYEELLAGASVEEYITLECVSNEIGGSLISNAKWSGIPLPELLSRAGVNREADYCVFWCVDDYTVGVPIGNALSPSTILALRMNDKPLPTEHGFPARIIIPGLYGMFNAKWVNRITLVKGEYKGFWQQKGWTNIGQVKTVALIRVPQNETVNGPVISIGGVAFAGDRDISSVEVSSDGGKTWAKADLKPPLSTYTWVVWTYQWSPPSSGGYRIMARAVDGSGTPQEARDAPPFPEGASGYDSINLQVAS